MSNKKKLTEEAIENIRKDRESAAKLLNNLLATATTKDEIVNIAIPCTKFLETLQRSNEQLVKIISVKGKDAEDAEDFSFSSEESEKFFEELKKVK